MPHQLQIIVIITLVPFSSFILPGDAPEEWGEDYLEVARARVMEARRIIAETHDGDVAHAFDACCIS
eukprot:CAMPEP_0118721290 /NCGR_PEP_ID=MMETSP0800-20121206/30633_1 /TAXON_ID=210618 ORGANISM="Striatella unipunctata, Strain CCMP2910" /NCGR_SAMPLE_ID=MMETSP0800 /ASSEMBLY_ACC=CAM_ASM_000638 /LENGTH=66 /DNA_ID=CAMNT_0006629123 /DNA_START=339 /DNA_END=539 /DNA_ORIENTATION=+